MGGWWAYQAQLVQPKKRQYVVCSACKEWQYLNKAKEKVFCLCGKPFDIPGGHTMQVRVTTKARAKTTATTRRTPRAKARRPRARAKANARPAGKDPKAERTDQKVGNSLSER
jgi:hypothetical protein